MPDTSTEEPPSLEAMLNQLSEQQAAITRALAAMGEGRWTGEDSVEAWLLALNPTWLGQLAPHPPVYERPAIDEIGAPDLKWIGSPNYWHGHGGHQVCALVLHTMAGSLAACDGWFRRPEAQVSAHFGIGLDGQQHQYVRLEDSAWANGILEPGHRWPGAQGSPNYQTISIETEDRGSSATPVTDAQYQATLEVAAMAVKAHPSIRWLLRHTDISPHSRAICCGPRWVNSGRFQTLADALHLETIG